MPAPFALSPLLQPLASLVQDPVSLQEAALDQGSGLFGDLDAAEILLEYAPISQPPYLVAGGGLAIAVLCGLTFARLVQDRLEAWKQDRLTMLPLANTATMLPYIGLVLGVSLFIGGCLQVFGFAGGAALLVAFVLALGTAGALWVQLTRLMQQVEAGNFRAVDFDNFDQFFSRLIPRDLAMEVRLIGSSTSIP